MFGFSYFSFVIGCAVTYSLIKLGSVDMTALINSGFHYGVIHPHLPDLIFLKDQVYNLDEMSQKELLDLSVRALNADDFKVENFQKVLDKLDRTSQQTIDNYSKINTKGLSNELRLTIFRRNF